MSTAGHSGDRDIGRYGCRMANPLLSTYRTGENRVTASTMAVFERVDLSLVREILAAATGAGDELRAVTFENQIVNDESIPDARISGRFTWWFETKTARGGYSGEGHDRNQVRKHSMKLVDDPEARLFVLTPDPVKPSWLEDPDGVDELVRARKQISWASFLGLKDAIEEILRPGTRPIGEQTRFLLAELISLYEADGLLTSDDTVIVAARSAWPEYNAISAYICQPDRTFREGLTHLGFYADGAIQPLIARIRRHELAIPFTYNEIEARRRGGDFEIADLIASQLQTRTRVEGDAYGVVLLSGQDDAETVHLVAPIINDTKAASGRTWAWTLSQRYTSLDKLRGGPATTSAL